MPEQSTFSHAHRADLTKEDVEGEIEKGLLEGGGTLLAFHQSLLALLSHATLSSRLPNISVFTLYILEPFVSCLASGVEPLSLYEALDIHDARACLGSKKANHKPTVASQQRHDP